MSISMNLFNIAILILLILIVENALRKIVQEKSERVTRCYWIFLFPSCVFAMIITVILLVLQPSNSLEPLLSLQKYALGAYFLSSLLFMAAIDGARTLKHAKKQRLSTKSI